ncbi:MAG: prepilin-type N-terminal cleavage/methylation domain-containing protein [Candidatus Margulisiibacteriota bacterium]|nr:prepilin-type N-terminal cleavage/methylation domain-containing protein [Candidatus Margulisiibacteriota bacterium]
MKYKGFSLIELLIVLGVIALINIIMLPNFSSLMSTAKATSAKSNVRSIMVSIEQYYFINQTYPIGSNVSISSVLDQLQASNIISTAPTNPFTGTVYSSSDQSGLVRYELLGTDEYRIQLYGNNNEELIFEYP